MKISGVYRIYNKISNKNYVGQSVNIYERWRRHKRELRNNVHDNQHLQSAWNLYGEDNFEFYIVELCDKSIIHEREKLWITKYDSFQNGYNKSVGGEVGEFTEETRRKMSKAKEKLMDMQKEHIKQHLREGILTVRELSELYGFKSTTPIMNIKRNMETTLRKFSERLSEEQVLKIRQLAKQGKKFKDIANILNVNEATVKNIVHYKTYKNIGDKDLFCIPKRRNIKDLTENDFLIIRKMREEGNNYTKISKAVNINRRTIKTIINNMEECKNEG